MGQRLIRFYVRAEVRAGNDTAIAEIAGDYTDIVRVVKNGGTVFAHDIAIHSTVDNPLLRYRVQELYDLILSMDSSEIGFLVDYAKINWLAAKADLGDSQMTLGSALKQSLKGDTAEDLVQIYTAAAGEARMCGKNVKIIAITGSGNHGITDFVGVYATALALGSTGDQLVHALAISSMITIYIKGNIMRMTAFCGCAVAAAAGVAAAAVYLLGGTCEQGVHAIHIERKMEGGKQIG
jgi:L-cysteine desulfidase